MTYTLTGMCLPVLTYIAERRLSFRECALSIGAPGRLTRRSQCGETPLVFRRHRLHALQE